MAIADQITGVESGGDPTATNPNSSATGAGQFISSTWLDTLAKHRPDLTGSPDELLAMRNDPQLSKEMTAAYAGDNQAILSKAGVPVTPGTTYLAHFAGPGGAVKVLQADPDAPVESILGDAVVKANPFLKGMTAQGLQAWAAKKMGVSAPTAGAQPQPAPVNGMQVADNSQPYPNGFRTVNVGDYMMPQFGTPQQMRPPVNGIFPSQKTPIFAPQPSPQQAPALGPQSQAIAPPPQMPIFAPQRRQIDLSGLKAALAARAPIFPGQSSG